jgi:hypothetical protein
VLFCFLLPVFREPLHDEAGLDTAFVFVGIIRPPPLSSSLFLLLAAVCGVMLWILWKAYRFYAGATQYDFNDAEIDSGDSDSDTEENTKQRCPSKVPLDTIAPDTASCLKVKTLLAHLIRANIRFALVALTIIMELQVFRRLDSPSRKLFFRPSD